MDKSNCLICGKKINTFSCRVKNGSGKYCSNRCKNEAQKNRKEFKCKICGKSFYRKISETKKGCGVYCSYQCSKEGRSKQIKRICVVCKKEFSQKASKMTKSRGFTCSRHCYYIHQRGMTQKNNQGKVKLHDGIRKMYEYRQWRSDVFHRDNFTCQYCGKYGGYIHAHHKVAMSSIIDSQSIKTIEQARNESMLWDINNGVTYCKECHYIVHELDKCSKGGIDVASVRNI